MTSAPFMQLYVGDYLADTQELSTEQHGAYLLLLFNLWRHNARLPNDPAKLARIARVTPKRWGRVWDGIKHFFYEDGEMIGNHRLDIEFQKTVSISQKRKVSGSRGGKANSLKYNTREQASADDLLEHSQISEPEEKEEPIVSSKRKSSSTDKATRLLDDWQLPKPWGDWAVAEEQLSASEVRRIAEQFKDYWLAVPGSKGMKRDWQATWRNWVRNHTDKHKPQKAIRESFGAFGQIPEVG